MNKMVVSIALFFIISNVNALEKKKYTIVIGINDKAHIVHIGNSGFTNQSKYIDLSSWDIKSKFKNALKKEALKKLSTNIQILDKNQFKIQGELYDVGSFLAESKIEFILKNASTLKTDYLIIFQSTVNHSITLHTYVASFDGYGFYSDARASSYDMRVNKSNASHFSLSAYIFDLKNKTYKGRKDISKINYLKWDRDLTGSEKDEVYNYVIEEETEKEIISKYKKLIYKEKINKSKIYDYYKKNNSHLEDDDFEENSWTLMLSLYPIHYTPDDFHLITDVEKSKLKKHFISMISDVSSDVMKLLPL